MKIFAITLFFSSENISTETCHFYLILIQRYQKYLITELSIIISIPPMKPGYGGMVFQHHRDSMADRILFAT